MFLDFFHEIAQILLTHNKIDYMSLDYERVKLSDSPVVISEGGSWRGNLRNVDDINMQFNFDI